MSEVIFPALATSSPPVALFQGFDSFLSAGRSTAVQGDSQETGAESNTRYKVCSDIKTLSQFLNISASVSASFGFGSVDAKTAFMSQLNVTTTSVAIVVYTRVVTSHPTSTRASLAVPPPKDLTSFFRSYGDSFLSDIAFGAEYMAVFLFESQTTNEQTDVQASLTQHGIDGFGVPDSSFEVSLNTARSETKVSTSFQQLMLGVSAPVYPTADKVLTFALDFGGTKPDEPVVISYNVKGYEHVLGMPNFSSIVTTRDLYLGVEGKVGLATQYAALKANLNACHALEAIYQTYGYAGDSLLPDRKDAISTDLTTLSTLFANMEANPTKNQESPNLPSLAFGTPAVNVSFDNSQSCGDGSQGTPFAELLDVTMVRKQARVSQLQFFARTDGFLPELTGLLVTYQHANGVKTIAHGGSGPTASQVLALKPGEWITQVYAEYGGPLVKISVEGDSENVLTWPTDGVSGNRRFSWKRSDPSQILLGFTGRSAADGSSLGSIVEFGLVLITFSPATWSVKPLS